MSLLRKRTKISAMSTCHIKQKRIPLQRVEGIAQTGLRHPDNPKTSQSSIIRSPLTNYKIMKKVFIIAALMVFAVYVQSCKKDDIITYSDWTMETHGTEAIRNYDVVFNQEYVQRIDIQISAENWAVMQNELLEVAILVAILVAVLEAVLAEAVLAEAVLAEAVLTTRTKTGTPFSCHVKCFSTEKSGTMSVSATKEIPVCEVLINLAMASCRSNSTSMSLRI